MLTPLQVLGKYARIRKLMRTATAELETGQSENALASLKNLREAISEIEDIIETPVTEPIRNQALPDLSGLGGGRPYFRSA